MSNIQDSHRSNLTHRISEENKSSVQPGRPRMPEYQRRVRLSARVNPETRKTLESLRDHGHFKSIGEAIDWFVSIKKGSLNKS